MKIEIGLPAVHLTHTQKRIKQLLEDGKSKYDICKLLRIPPEEYYMEMSRIHECEYINQKHDGGNKMGSRVIFSPDECEKIIQMYRDGMSNLRISEAMGRTPGSIAVKLSQLRKEQDIGARGEASVSSRTASEEALTATLPEQSKQLRQPEQDKPNGTPPAVLDAIDAELARLEMVAKQLCGEIDDVRQRQSELYVWRMEQDGKRTK